MKDIGARTEPKDGRARCTGDDAELEATGGADSGAVSAGAADAKGTCTCGADGACGADCAGAGGAGGAGGADGGADCAGAAGGAGGADDGADCAGAGGACGAGGADCVGASGADGTTGVALSPSKARESAVWGFPRFSTGIVLRAALDSAGASIGGLSDLVVVFFFLRGRLGDLASFFFGFFATG